MSTLYFLEAAEINVRKTKAIVENWKRRIDKPGEFKIFEAGEAEGYKIWYAQMIDQYMHAHDKWTKACIELEFAETDFLCVESTRPERQASFYQ